MSHIEPSVTSLLCPVNDGESQAIVDIAARLSLDVRVSPQGWGARLEHEPQASFLALESTVIIVEIPGPAKEEELRRHHRLFIVDHHRYPDLDRRHSLSSLEQFAELTAYSLNRWELGVAINDRSFIYGLVKEGYSQEEIEKIRMFDLKHQGYTASDFETLEADFKTGWDLSTDLFVIETHSQKNSYLSDLYCAQNNYKNPQRDLLVLRLDGEERVVGMTLQGSPSRVKMLSDLAGGVSGGDEEMSMYWFKIPANPITKEDAILMVTSALTQQ